VLRDGAVIPLERTVVPLELDQIYSSVADLSHALGPYGANKHGELSSVLHAFAQLADGNGTAVHTAIEKISAALPALTAHPNELAALITGLDRVTRTLAAHGSTIDKLYGDLATATTQISDERQTLSAAIANLQRGLVEVTTFLRQNRSHITGSVHNLNDTIASIMSEQKSLIQTFDTAPLGFQNFNRTIQPNGPCISATGAPDNCASLWGRLDLPSDAWAFVQNYCGNSVLYSMTPIVESNAGLAKPSAADTACGAQVGLLVKQPGAPGAPKTPDLDLSHYLESR
jgi:ABC-type transporter Mla subunit MlaD